MMIAGLASLYFEERRIFYDNDIGASGAEFAQLDTSRRFASDDSTSTSVTKWL